MLYNSMLYYLYSFILQSVVSQLFQRFLEQTLISLWNQHVDADERRTVSSLHFEASESVSNFAFELSLQYDVKFTERVHNTPDLSSSRSSCRNFQSMKMSKPTNRLGEGDYSEQTQRYRWFNERSVYTKIEYYLSYSYMLPQYLPWVHNNSQAVSAASNDSSRDFEDFSVIKRSANAIDCLTNLCVSDAKLTNLI